MEKNIENIAVKRFRGIKDLHLSRLKRINVVLGDNNSGKTSLLEAIQILGNPSFGNILKVCNQRDIENSPISFLTSLLYSFPKDEDKESISLSTQFGSGNKLEVSLEGKEEEVLVGNYLTQEKKEFAKILERIYSLTEDKAVRRFSGTLNITQNNKKEKKEVSFGPLDLFQNDILINSEKSPINVVYLSSIDLNRIDNSLFSLVHKNEKYRDICVRILQLFDNTIEDLILMKNEFNQSLECLKSKGLGILPLSNYGDGIKQVLSIAGGLAKAHNGILLIDEFERGIHAKNYNDIFSFLDKASEAYNVQIFMTTHSLEAIDEFLKIKENGKGENIQFITLKKDKETRKTLSRILDFAQVKRSRENFNLEVRL